MVKSLMDRVYAIKLFILLPGIFYMLQPAPAPVAPPPPCPQPPCKPACQPEQPQCPKPVIPRPCPQAQCGGSQCGGLCSWMLAQLKPAGTGYMQCVPKLAGKTMQYCGQWIRRPCPSGTKFNAQLQVCVHDPRGSSCPAPQIPIGPCNVQQQCPGQASCQVRKNVCCQPGR